MSNYESRRIEKKNITETKTKFKWKIKTADERSVSKQENATAKKIKNY